MQPLNQSNADVPVDTRRSRRWRSAMVIQFIIGLAALIIVLWRVDVLGAFGNLPELQLQWALAGAAIFSLSKLVHAYRWRWFLRHRQGLEFRRLFELLLVSNLANAMVPLRAGDLLRVELPNRRWKVPRAELASSVFLVESLLDGVSFVVLAFTALLLFDLPSTFRPAVGVLAITVLLLTAGSVRAAIHGQTWSVDGSIWRYLIPIRARPHINHWLKQAVLGMNTLTDWRSALVAVVLSLLAWTLEVGVWWCIGKAFSIELAYSEALVVMIAANMAQALPITPWNIGPYEVAVTEILVLLGASRLDGSSYAIGARILLMIWIAATGLVAMWSLDLRFRDLLNRKMNKAPRGTMDSENDP